MKKTISILTIILLVISSCTQEKTQDLEQNQEQVNNLKTFAKAYGYVKYFHPSDEASAIDWNYFAAYGASEIIKCKTSTEVINTLNRLFKPIAPSAVFSSTKGKYDFAAITPENKEEYQSTYWQHKGVSLYMSNQSSPYKSVRVNRFSEIDEGSRYCNLSLALDVEQYRGKKIKYTAWVKRKEASKGDGFLWMRVNKSDNTMGFFDNMGSRPIKSSAWQEYEIIGEVDPLGATMNIGTMFSGKGTLFLDDVHLYYQENDEWIEIPIKNSDFEADEIGTKNENSDWGARGEGYTFTVSKTEKKEGNNGVALAYQGKIKKVKGESVFEGAPKFEELIEKEIGNGIFCQIPLNLYGNDQNTYPIGEGLKTLQDAINSTNDSPKELTARLGNIIISYNVFQHFFPYFKEIDTDWENSFDTALKQSFKDKTENDHLVTLEQFSAGLKDGHVWVSGGSFENYVPPIRWEWIEDKLVITKVLKDSLELNVGDVVTKVNNKTSKDYFKEVNSRISAGTKGWLNQTAKTNSLFGNKDSIFKIEVDNKSISLKHDMAYIYGTTEIEIQKNKYKQFKNGIYYLNLDTIEMDTITSLLPALKEAKGIICDMRGYPNSNHDFISHLLKEKDTSTAWLRTQKIIYPDQENLLGYVDSGWEMEPKTPYLGDKKIVFIIDGRAISYAESYMSFIEGYKLATIVGQPTAGANGNINPFGMLGNFRMSWTGMKAVKHDGSQHHAIGILPNIYVNKTIEGLKAGKDEFLDKAIEVILDENID